MIDLDPTAPCPCGSGKPFADCCGPILGGAAKAPTAEALMRARYAAYATANLDFLYESSGPEVRQEFDREASRKWAEGSRWTGLDILAVDKGGANDDTGTVEFVAHYAVANKHFNHRERASFRRIAGDWRFIDGKILAQPTIQRETAKVGRNDPCPCGSGKKYKHCCGR